jgi:hypothetical protein
MNIKRILSWGLLPLFLVTGAYAYRAANPPIITPVDPVLPSLLSSQVTVIHKPVPLLSPSFTHANKIHGFEVNVFRRANAFFLQIAPHVDADAMDYLVDPITIGAAQLEYWVNGVPYIYNFGSSGNVWIASLPYSVAAGGVQGAATLRIWRTGTDYSSADAAAFTRNFGVTPF